MGCALKILFVMQADVDCPVHHSLNLSARFWQLSKTASCTTSGHFAENKGVQLKKSSATQALLMPLGRCQAVPAGIYPPKLPFLSGKMMIIQLNCKCKLFFRHMMVFVQETLLRFGSNPQISSCMVLKTTQSTTLKTPSPPPQVPACREVQFFRLWGLFMERREKLVNITPIVTGNLW